MECIQEVKTWGGFQRVFRHASKSTRCDMEFAVFTPSVATSGPLPALFYLSGLTCTWANVADKAGAQRFAAEHGLMLVMPDTSPRGLHLEGEDEETVLDAAYALERGSEHPLAAALLAAALLAAPAAAAPDEEAANAAGGHLCRGGEMAAAPLLRTFKLDPGASRYFWFILICVSAALLHMSGIETNR